MPTNPGPVAASIAVLRCLALLFALSLSSAWPGDAVAQSGQPMPPFGRSVADWNRTFVHTRALAALPELAASQVQPFLADLAEIRRLATAFREQASEKIDSLAHLAEAMGPPPAADAEPEPPALAAKRKQNAEDTAFYRARVAEAELALVRVSELEETLSARLREALVSSLFRQYPLSFMPATIQVAIPDLAAHMQALVRSPFEWWAGQSEEAREAARWRHLTVVVVVLLAALVGWAIRRVLLRRFGRDPAETEPSYRRRLTAAVAEGVARGIVPALMLAGVLWHVSGPGAAIDGLFAEAIAALAVALIVLVLALALPRAVLAPYLPAWRLTGSAAAEGRVICRRIALLAVVYAVDVFLNRTAPASQISPELMSFYALVSNGIEGGLLLLLVSGRLWRLPAEAGDEAEVEPSRRPLIGFWGVVRFVIGLVAAAGIAAALLGLSRLSFHLIENLIVSGLIVGVLFLLRGLLRELIGGFTRSALVVRGLKLSHRGRQLIKFWGRAALDLVLAVLGVAAIVPNWGVPVADLARWLGRLLHGFQVGGVTISVLDIGVALGVFMIGLLVTRMLQRALSERILPQTQLDAGLRNSLASGLGYVGLVLAVALAVSVVGIDLSNIALIAGALSVGIGFGLQNVVNNFVSGLILLVERPVKVGDWVVIGQNEGFVRRINVRATELETFQRASVIIPNADLLSTAVVNWTHKDRHGRIEIPIGVAYGSDTALVRDVLLEIAGAEERLLGWPEPFVVFRDFGASSLDFELRCYTGEVIQRLRIASDLRFAIDARFRQAGIEIPFPQRVVHIAPTEAESQS